TLVGDVGLRADPADTRKSRRRDRTNPTSYEASLVKLRVIWSTVSDLSHLFDPPGSVAGPEGAWRGRPAGWVDGVQGRPADHLLSVPACVAGHPIPRAP